MVYPLHDDKIRRGNWQLRSGVIYVICVICKHEFPRQHTNFLFSDGTNEIRVCYRCDT